MPPKSEHFRACLVLAILFCSVLQLTAATFGNFTYTDNGTNITITGYPASVVGVVVIPSTINSKPVTSIGNYAFYNCSALTSVTIPSGVTNIGYAAFAYCSSLASVTIPPTVKTIGQEAFDRCTSLASVTIPAGIINIESSTFHQCTSLTNVTIPIGVINLGNYVFMDCTSLTSVTIPSSVTSIGSSAFLNCAKLTSVTIPLGVTSISDSAFYNCNSLTSVTIPPSVTSIGPLAFYKCFNLASLTIPFGVTSIERIAFAYCTSLTSVTIPASVNSIGDQAFALCSSLISFSVDSNNTYYSSLDGVMFNKNQTMLLQYPIAKTGSSYIVPSGVTSIGSSAFYGCVGLTSLTLPSGFTSIGDYAFYGCVGLTSLTLPSDVTSIGDYAFYGCSNLTGVYFKGPPLTFGPGVAFTNANNLIIYYLIGTTGWNTTYGGRPTASYSLSLYNFHSSHGLTLDGLQDLLTPAGDGVTNLYKYAFNMLGSGPGQAVSLNIPNNHSAGTTGSAGLPYSVSKVNDQTVLQWTYIRRKASTLPGITYIVEFTDDLASPSWATNPLAAETPVSIDSTFERVTVTDSVANASKRFSRVRVTSP